MTAVAERSDVMITEPGVYEISEAVYFGSQHALSCSGAKLLLPPSCPAKFFWQQDHPVYKDVFDYGSAAHRVVLGSGPEIEVIDAACLQRLAGSTDDPKVAKLYGETAAKGDPEAWTTSAAKAAKAAARAAGRIPLLRHDYERTIAMADAIRLHPMANALLNPDYGHAEQSLFWRDAESGILLRSRFDVLRDKVSGPLMIPDYKTADSADPDTFARSAANYGYHMQDAWYTDGAAALGYPKPRVLFVVQEKEAPYLVSVVELDYDSRRAGRRRYRRAINEYLKCVASGDWPGYVADNDIRYISLPAWAIRREDFS
jgi:hypothetical protein